MINRLKFFLLGLASVVALTGCVGNVSKVASLEFSLIGQGVEENELVGTTMTMVPNYDERTIVVTYKEDSSNTEEDKLSEAIFGGEQFDRFEKSVEIIKENELKSDQTTEPFSVKFVDLEGKSHYFMQTADNIEELDQLNFFYFDILDLLTVEEQV